LQPAQHPTIDRMSEPTFVYDTPPSTPGSQASGDLEPPVEDAVYIGKEKPTKSNRWKVVAALGGCCVLVVILLILVLVFALKKDDTAAENNRAIAPEDAVDDTPPVATPVASPVAESPVQTPVTAPADDIVCPEAEAAYQTCVQDLPQENSCLACINTVLGTADRTSCNGFATDFCQANCALECGKCLGTMEDYIDCVVGESCLIDCNAEDPGTGEALPPALAPVSAPGMGEDECAVQEFDYQLCLDTMPPAVSELCVDCANTAIGTSQNTAQLCRTFDFCSACDACEEQILDFMACAVVVGGRLDCSCTVDETNYQSCVGTLPEPQKCLDCVNGHLGSAKQEDTCLEFRTTYCAGHNLCELECGDCLGDLESWVDCAIGGEACPVDCSDAEEPECTVEHFNYQTCLNGIATPQECVDCTNDALNNDAMGFCNDFGLCSTCGDCSDEIEDWVDCVNVQDVSCP